MSQNIEMRSLINLVEGKLGEASAVWCFNRAKSYEGACQDEKTEDFDWNFDPAFPVDKIEPEHDFASWWKDEVEMWANEGDPDRFEDMLNGSEIYDPIIIHVDNDGSGRIWDGWHRTASQKVQNIPTIPAIVGVRKLAESLISPEWDLGGAWVLDTGEVIQVDHANGVHHSDIALQEFGEHIDTNDEGEHDEYSAETAFDLAYDEGWIRISTRGTRSFSIEWRSTITLQAKRALLNVIKNDPNTYGTYEIESPETQFEQFDDAKTFVNRLRVLLR